MYFLEYPLFDHKQNDLIALGWPGIQYKTNLSIY